MIASAVDREGLRENDRGLGFRRTGTNFYTGPRRGKRNNEYKLFFSSEGFRFCSS